MTQNAFPYISIQPNRITTYYQRDVTQPTNSTQNQPNQQPRNNNTGRDLSAKAAKRLKSKIQWLLTFSKPKKIFNDYTNRYFTFNINFITLTLPTPQAHHDTTIKSQALNQFITELRKSFQLENYVWRAEAQRNGNIHFHFVTDTYLPWFVIRRIWNRQLRKLGYIDRYHQKFSNMSWKDYVKYSQKIGVKDLSIIKKRFDYGKKTNWTDPNTTDIHSVQKIRNIGAYLSKYMAKGTKAKSKDGRYNLQYRRISGRLWGCSASLSKCKSIIELRDSTFNALMDAAAAVKNAFVLQENYFTFIGVDFKQLGARWVQYINKLFLNYKASINYHSGTIPNKQYQYKPT